MTKLPPEEIATKAAVAVEVEVEAEVALALLAAVAWMSRQASPG